MAKSKKDGGQRYDWNLIMTDYVTNSDSSLRKIAEKYGIRFTTVKDKAKADSWFATKQEPKDRLLAVPHTTLSLEGKEIEAQRRKER